MEEINLNLDKTITEKEIEKAKKSMASSALMENQSNSSLAWTMAFYETVGLGADYYNKLVDLVQQKHINKESLLKASEIFKGNKVIYVLKPATEK